MEPRRQVLTPDLDRWLAAATAREGAAAGLRAGDERRTVIVRLPGTADAEQAADLVRDAGAAVQTAGAASVTAVVTADALRRLAAEPWVVAIEEPRRLFPTGEAGGLGGPDVPDL